LSNLEGSSADRMAPWIRKKVRGILPNMVFVEKIVAFDDIKLQGYSDGSIYVAHWTPDEIEIDTCQPLGDYIEIYKDGDDYRKKLEFKLGFKLQTRVDPERVNAALYVKCKMKTDRLGERSLEWDGLENQIEFSKDFGDIPGVADFGRQNMVFEIEYRYKWPDNTDLLISTEEIQETLLIFFQKKYDYQYPPAWKKNMHGWATYDKHPANPPDIYWPNWYRYWKQLNIFNGTPFNVEKSVYDHNLSSNGEWGTRYVFIDPDSAVKIYKIGYPAALDNGRIVNEVTNWHAQMDTAFYVKGIHKFVFTARHENEHRRLFEEWWGTWENYEELKDSLDPDGDCVPDSVEENYDPPLDPENPKTYRHPIVPHPIYGYDFIDHSYTDFEFILYHGYHYQWKVLIKDTLVVELKTGDWAYPGKQTEPEE